MSETVEQSYEQWEVTGKQYWPIAQTAKTLPPGYYEPAYDEYRSGKYYLTKIPVSTESLLRFPDSESDIIIDEITKFWDNEKRFRDHGLVFKRGLLLYGPPGSGKSCTIRLICEDVIDREGIVVKWTKADWVQNGVRIVRDIQGDTPIVVLIEDIDGIMEGDQHEVSSLLNLLDGVGSPDKVVFLATTNYPEKLQRRIANRPSRFDRRFRIGPPNDEARKMYFESLGTIPSARLDKWVVDTDGLSVAHLKELFVQVLVLDNDYDEALKNLREMSKKIPEEPENEPGPVGFAGGGAEDEAPPDTEEKVAVPMVGRRRRGRRGL